MSRVGKKPIPVPKGVDVQVDGNTVRVRGPKGALDRVVKGPVTVEFDEAAGRILVTRNREDKFGRAQHGLWRALIANMVSGVTDGVVRVLEIIGLGYRAEVVSARDGGKTLSLHVGFAVPVAFAIPDGLTVEVTKPTRPGVTAEIHMSGVDKELVSQFAALVRKTRPPDPYHGKGLRYRGEYVRKLAGKTFGSTT